MGLRFPHLNISLLTLVSVLILGCVDRSKKDLTVDILSKNQFMTAADILGNPEYQAICYGGYRQKTREVQPTVVEIKEDLKILNAMGIKILRTYNVHLPQAQNILNAIVELKSEVPKFEMYVMLGAWIDCKNAWTDELPDHNIESEQNAEEIEKAVSLVKSYPEIIKVLAVGNEAMVNWATSYYVQPSVILKWVSYLQELKKNGELPKDLWITSSDDFSSWGGGDPSYHTEDLTKLIKAVDYISMHTYPMHNSHYNPSFWIIPEQESEYSKMEKIDSGMERALKFAQRQYDSVVNYMKSLGVNKPVHIGETGWATTSNGHYGVNGSRAADEYKSGLYYKMIRKWTDENNISCFFFEAFDEQWKDAKNPMGSENHFGLINLKSEAKFAIWDFVDSGNFEGLTRDGETITKTFNGDKETLFEDVLEPPKEYPGPN